MSVPIGASNVNSLSLLAAVDAFTGTGSVILFLIISSFAVVEKGVSDLLSRLHP